MAGTCGHAGTVTKPAVVMLCKLARRDKHIQSHLYVMLEVGVNEVAA